MESNTPQDNVKRQHNYKQVSYIELSSTKRDIIERGLNNVAGQVIAIPEDTKVFKYGTISDTVHGLYIKLITNKQSDSIFKE